jgi:hypothetical protein
MTNVIWDQEKVMAKVQAYKKPAAEMRREWAVKEHQDSVMTSERSDEEP